LDSISQETRLPELWREEGAGSQVRRRHDEPNPTTAFFESITLV